MMLKFIVLVLCLFATMEAKEKGGGGCGKNGKNLYRKDGRKVQYKEDEDSEHIR